MHTREVCRLSRLTLPAVSKHINRGESDGIITIERRGGLKISRLDFKSPRLVPILQEVELGRFHELPHKIQSSFSSFVEDLEERPLIALIFGSFAKSTHSKRSDLDVLLVFQRIDNKLTKSIELSAAKIKGRTMVNIQPVSLGYDEFEKEISDKENGFMDDIRKNALVLHGLDAYLRLIGRFYG